MKNRKHRDKPVDPNVAAFDNDHAAEYIGFSPVSLKMSRNSGLLGSHPAPPFKRAGRKILYLRQALDEWLESLPTYQNNVQTQNESRQS